MLEGQGRHRARTALGIGAAVLVLGACGSSSGESADEGPSALAATVDGQEITVAEVQTASRQLSTYSAAQAEASGQAGQQITPEALITSLTQVPAILQYGKDQGMDIPSPATVERNLAPAVTSPSEETIDFFRASQVYSQLDGKGQREIAEQVQQSEVTLSPRYAKAAGEAPNWLQKSEPQMQLPGQ